MSASLLLVGHGSASPAATAEAHELASHVRRLRPDIAVELGNLELAPPTIDDGLGKLVGGGARDIVAVPVLLGSARHDKHDIPDALEDARARWPHIRLAYTATLGEEPALVDLVAARVQEATRLADAAAPPAATPSGPARAGEKADGGDTRGRTTVVIVRAGSSDPDARTYIRRIAVALQQHHGYDRVEHAFAGIAEPGIADVLDRCYRDGSRQIVVVPYMLFGGLLVDRVREHTRSFAQAHPQARAVTAPHIGPDVAVAKLLVDRYTAGAPSTVNAT